MMKLIGRKTIIVVIFAIIAESTTIIEWMARFPQRDNNTKLLKQV